jgi:hypothetical protein
MLLDPYNVNIFASSNIKSLTFFYSIIYDITRTSNLHVPGGKSFSKTRICGNPSTLLLISEYHIVTKFHIYLFQDGNSIF